MADRLSPLAELAIPGEFGALTNSAGVTLSEEMPASLVQVACWPETVEECTNVLSRFLGEDVGSTNRAVSTDSKTVLPVSPGRWWIVGDDEDAEAVLRSKLSGEVASVTGLSHGRVKVNIRGEKAAWVLATGIALDFDVRSFAVETVQVSHHHEVGLTIHRLAEDSFDLYLFTSFARDFWGWLTRASAEIGYRVE